MKKVYLETDTIAAIATATGSGAIGIVRISGLKAIALTSSLVTLSHFKSFNSVPSRKSLLGTFHQNGTCIDKILLTVFRAPHSYTGEDVVEISCHGSPAVLKQILILLLKSGVRLAEPGEFSQRSFLNGKMDLAQAEAVADLISAQTEFSRSAALAQLEGNISREVRQLRDSLVELLAHIEVGIDHSDDSSVGATMVTNEIEKRLDESVKRVTHLIQSYEFGRIAREGIKIAIVGKPNVGKSSLLNRLLKSDRAIVTATPGTTRDTIEEGFDLLGLPAILVDTAGIRQRVTDPIEKIGIERTEKSLVNADAAIFVLDSNTTFSEEDRKIAEMIRNKEKILIALNKKDLPMKIDQNEVKKILSKTPVVSTSTLYNIGIEQLLQELYKIIFPLEAVEKSLAGEMVVTSLRHRDCLSKSKGSLIRASSLCSKNDLEECLALEIRDAIDSLGEIIGETVTEDILKEIFSKFCIGK